MARSAALMMRGSVSIVGSPLDRARIRRPDALAARTRSVISTVADGLREVTRSTSERDINRIPKGKWCQADWAELGAKLICDLSQGGARKPAAAKAIISAKAASRSAG